MKTTRLYYVSEPMKSVVRNFGISSLYTGGGLDYFGLSTHPITYYLVDEDGENEIPKTLDELAKIAYYDERYDSSGIVFEGTTHECLRWLAFRAKILPSTIYNNNGIRLETYLYDAQSHGYSIEVNSQHYDNERFGGFKGDFDSSGLVDDLIDQHEIVLRVLFDDETVTARQIMSAFGRAFFRSLVSYNTNVGNKVKQYFPTVGGAK